MKPVWLMDVDGVLNIIGWGSDGVKKAWDDTYRFVAMGFQITVSPRMIRSIEGWRRSGLVEVRWLTTWEDHANEFLSPEFDWPQNLQVAGRREESQLERPRKFSESRVSYREDVGWWKLEFAQAVYETGVPVIWTDDDIAFAPDAKEWLRTVDDDRMLAISPHSGLTPGDLVRIERFIKRWNDQAST